MLHGTLDADGNFCQAQDTKAASWAGVTCALAPTMITNQAVNDHGFNRDDFLSIGIVMETLTATFVRLVVIST